MTRTYTPPDEGRKNDPTWPGGAWGRGGGTLPMFVSEDAAAWLLTADEDHGQHQAAVRMTDADPVEMRPMLARYIDFWDGDRERAKAVFKELHHTGLAGEAGYFGHYRTEAGEIIADRLRARPDYLATT